MATTIVNIKIIKNLKFRGKLVDLNSLRYFIFN